MKKNRIGIITLICGLICGGLLNVSATEINKQSDITETGKKANIEDIKNKIKETNNENIKNEEKNVKTSNITNKNVEDKTSNVPGLNRNYKISKESSGVFYGSKNKTDVSNPLNKEKNEASIPSNVKTTEKSLDGNIPINSGVKPIQSNIPRKYNIQDLQISKIDDFYIPEKGFTKKITRTSYDDGSQEIIIKKDKEDTLGYGSNADRKSVITEISNIKIDDNGNPVNIKDTTIDLNNVGDSNIEEKANELIKAVDEYNNKNK